MRIVNQERSVVIKMPNEIWITREGDRWQILSSSQICRVLGSYKTKFQASEVLKEIYTSYGSKNKYMMPKEY